MALTVPSACTCARVGYGIIAPLHEQKFQAAGVETVAIIETDESKREKIGKLWATLEEAAQKKPFFWDICTPPSDHLTTIKKIITLDPLAKILVEKPVCLSSEISELQALLKDFKGSFVVNENYLSSDIVSRVVKEAETITTVKRIVVEMDKNRVADVKKGRYIDPEGAFKYEGTHMLTILNDVLKARKLSLPQAPTSVTYTDMLSHPNQGSAHVVYDVDGCQIELFTSMTGSLRNHYVPYGREPIPENDTTRYRVVAIEGTEEDGTAATVAGFFEPLPSHDRSLGEVVISKNGKIEQKIENIPDDTMGKHLARAVGFFCGKTTTNPCPAGLAIDIVRQIDPILQF